MNILHLSAIRTWGGGENHIFNLVKEFRKSSSEDINIVLCLKNSELHQQLKSEGLTHSTSNLSLKIDPRFSGKIISICKKEKIDLIHIHDSTALTLAIIADKLYNLPPFILSKKTSFPIKDRRQTLYKYNYSKIKKILCVSEETKRVTSNSILDKEKLETVYHGTNLFPQNHQTSFNLKERLGLSADKILIGNIANHIRAKDLDTLINVLDLLINSKNRLEFHFIQIGKHSKRTEALLKKVKFLELNDHISCLGFLPNASQLISQFDISLMTSQSEGVPQFIYESFLYKTPVVSTKVGGIPEIIKNGENGFLAPAHDHIKIANALITLSDDVSLQENFVRRSYKLLLESFSTEIMAQKTMDNYKKVIHGKYQTGNRNLS